MDVLAWLFGITFKHRALADATDQHRIWGALLRALLRHYQATGQVDSEGQMVRG